eukprot:1152933-Pelagomonas_calceolata.AAC.5
MVSSAVHLKHGNLLLAHAGCDDVQYWGLQGSQWDKAFSQNRQRNVANRCNSEPTQMFPIEAANRRGLACLCLSKESFIGGQLPYIAGYALSRVISF